MLTVDLNQVQLDENVTAEGPIHVSFPFHSAAGTTDSAAVLFELDPGGSLATHRDSAEEVLLVLEGEAEATVGEERDRLRTGQLAVVPPLVPHYVATSVPRGFAYSASSPARQWLRPLPSRSRLTRRR